MDTDPGGSILLQLLVLLILTLVNAFFAGSEMAIVSLNKSRIHMMAEEGDKRAIKVEKVVKEPTNFLSTIQIAITLAGFFSSASAATGISVYLGSFLESVGIAYGTTISFYLVTILLSFFTLVFGELVPKRVALANAEKFSLMVIGVINFVSVIASPFVKLLSATTNLVVKIFGIDSQEVAEQVTEEEIRAMMETGQESGVFDEKQTEMMTGMFEFDDLLAREVMTPRTNVYAIDINEDINDIMEELLNCGHSRIPVYDDEIDDIIGIIHVRDISREAFRNGFKDMDLRALMNDPYFVPETKKINDLFYELQRQKKYMAIVIDEYGGFAGVVTMEDIVEEIMGDIEDEYDEDEETLHEIGENHYIVDGMYSLNDLSDDLDIEIDSEDSDTVSGLIIEQLGYIPTTDDRSTVVIDNLEFKILAVEDRCIVQAELLVHELTQEDDEDE